MDVPVDQVADQRVCEGNLGAVPARNHPVEGGGAVVHEAGVVGGLGGGEDRGPVWQGIRQSGEGEGFLGGIG